ncbi:MAG: PQQ-like beta-propeller repeat protein [Planctomycetes bacterium]|nr:PQQ-like beta-propeller repeat protein [Planctomycetota bacterium]
MRTFCLSLLLVFVFLTVLPSESKAIVGEKLLNQAGLKTAWQNAIALNPKEKIQKITVLGGHLYILTDNNYLFCLDRHTGRLNFAFSAATLGLPVLEPTVYNNIAYLVAANYLIAINLEQGMEIYRSKMPFPVSTAIAVNASYIYVPAMDKRLHVMDPNGRQSIFEVSTDNASAITSVLATDSFTIFTTDGGNVIRMNPSRPKRIWEFKAVGAIEATPVIVQNQLYVSSKDTNLYKLNVENGSLAWKFQTGAFLTTSARATETTVYQYAINKGLYAIDAESGKQIWLLPDGIDLLAQDGDTAYVFDKNNICLVMDNKQAKNTHKVNFASVTNFVANPYDSNIYIMENKNISCIKPIKK